jgi:hypothetical protein
MTCQARLSDQSRSRANVMAAHLDIVKPFRPARLVDMDLLGFRVGEHLDASLGVFLNGV